MALDPQEEIKRQLDAVVGESYEPPRNWSATIAKWLAFAALAVVAAVVVVEIIDVHMTKAQKEAAKKRPIPVFVVPAK